MVKRRSLAGARCPVARSLDAIGDWWSLMIVRDAFDGARRFGEFQRSLGAAKNILAARLRTLVAQGVLQAIPAANGGAHLEYVLTEKGRGLFPVIVALRQWGEDHCFQPDEPRSVLVDVAYGRPLPRIELRAEDGRPLTPDETIVRKANPAHDSA